ncbi:hypothetical protein [Streptosporangium saharense]|uniref:Uncharacterized protein n=1 Tax=Streptosporangium saharense TaxID=1706840 RepID=A0A7W7QQD2_9ACTN|nr:hypothetical protein [Streptosporangium saharense]MBB4917845.1 hypothetical protein [Streptosporangium saharense]
MTADDLVFGIYPGGAVGDENGGLLQGPPDDPDRITEALDHLRVSLVRGYVSFSDPGDAYPQAPERVEQYATGGRMLDLVAQYRSRSGDVAGYVAFVRDLVRRHGARVATLQVTEEPNLPVYDGSHPRVLEALVEGVVAAKEEARLLGLDHLRVGFNTTPLFGPAEGFVAALTADGGPRFVAALDYVGLDFFPDVFQPAPADGLGEAVAGLLGHHRDRCLTPAGIDESVPLWITENGWPTGPERSPRRQADVLETIVTAVVNCRIRRNIGGYTHFALRDADSTKPGLFYRFGLLTDDYRPKPAFDTYQRLVKRFGSAQSFSPS